METVTTIKNRAFTWRSTKNNTQVKPEPQKSVAAAVAVDHKFVMPVSPFKGEKKSGGILKAKKKAFKPSWSITDSGYTDYLISYDMESIDGDTIVSSMSAYYDKIAAHEIENTERDNRNRAERNQRQEQEAASDK